MLVHRRMHQITHTMDMNGSQCLSLMDVHCSVILILRDSSPCCGMSDAGFDGRPRLSEDVVTSRVDDWMYTRVDVPQNSVTTCHTVTVLPTTRHKWRR